jgi:hemolysin D
VVIRGRTKVIQPSDTGVVHAIRVADGDRVEKGQVLIELDPTISTADKTRYTDQLAQARVEIREWGLKTQFGNKIDYLQSQQQLVEMQHEQVAEQKKRDEVEAALAELAAERSKTEPSSNAPF